MQEHSRIHAVLVTLAVILAAGVIVEGYFLVRGVRETAVPAGGAGPGQAARMPLPQPGAVPASGAAPAGDPYEEMLLMQQKIDRMFQEMMARCAVPAGLPVGRAVSFPTVDTKETETEYVIMCDLPGMEQDKISIYFEGERLVITGTRETEKQVAGAQGAARTERQFGSFRRAVPLPPDTDKGSLQAEYKNGVLTVIVPKTRPAAPAPDKEEGKIL